MKKRKKIRQRDPIALLMWLTRKGGAMKNKKKEQSKKECRKKVQYDGRETN